MILRHARGELALDRCLVMGIVNRTPDSFYDGGRMGLVESAAHADRLVAEGAQILDIGAVKAGPGDDVEEQEEIERLIPLVEAVAANTAVPISVETSRASVASMAIEAGAAMVNDVSGLRDPELASACARSGAAIILMHNGGQIRGRPRHPRYEDAMGEVVTGLEALDRTAQSSGIGVSSLVWDPGLDFGKTTYHSLELVRRLPELVAAGRPVLVAASRKDLVGETLGLGLDQRLEGSLAIVALSVLAGVHIVRVHDVAASVRTVRMVEAVLGRVRPRNPVRGLWD